MTEGIEEGQIIKVDVKGRTLVSRQRREALLAEFEKSGMSGAAFAKWAGIKYQTFALWVRKRRGGGHIVSPQVPVEKKTSGNNTQSLRWVEAVVDQAPPNVGSVRELDWPCICPVEHEWRSAMSVGRCWLPKY